MDRNNQSGTNTISYPPSSNPHKDCCKPPWEMVGHNVPSVTMARSSVGTGPEMVQMAGLGVGTGLPGGAGWRPRHEFWDSRKEIWSSAQALRRRPGRLHSLFLG
jgi:hypothetical protein